MKVYNCKIELFGCKKRAEMYECLRCSMQSYKSLKVQYVMHIKFSY